MKKNYLLAALFGVALLIPPLPAIGSYVGWSFRRVETVQLKPNNDYGADCGLFPQGTAERLAESHLLLVYCNKNLPGCPHRDIPLSVPVTLPSGVVTLRPECSTPGIKDVCYGTY